MKKELKMKESKEEKQKRNITCYKYNKRGHYKPEGPLLKKNSRRSKKSAIVRYLGRCDISSLNEEEDVANFCLMTIDDEVYYENSFKFIFDELFEVFNDLMDEYK